MKDKVLAILSVSGSMALAVAWNPFHNGLLSFLWGMFWGAVGARVGYYFWTCNRGPIFIVRR
jgi:tetrahydromethanopterin S-methyltransferase subunit E